MGANADTVEVDLIFKAIGASAYLFEDADGKELWLPKSQCVLDDPDPDTTVTVEIPEWLAKDRGLI